MVSIISADTTKIGSLRELRLGNTTFKTLNTIIVAINTIPALVTFHKSGYNSKGYFINEGFVEFLLDKVQLKAPVIDLKSDFLLQKVMEVTLFWTNWSIWI